MTKNPSTQPVEHDEDVFTQAKFLGLLTVAYVLDVADLLPPFQKEKLDSLRYPGCDTWDEAVEDSYGINRKFVRSIYDLCSELKGPEDALIFILQGIGCSDFLERLQEFFGGCPMPGTMPAAKGPTSVSMKT